MTGEGIDELKWALREARASGCDSLIRRVALTIWRGSMIRAAFLRARADFSKTKRMGWVGTPCVRRERARICRAVSVFK